MDNTKLNNLAGRAMGWELSRDIELYTDGQWFILKDGQPETMRQWFDWNPAGCADDALVLLNKVSDNYRDFTIRKLAASEPQYYCLIGYLGGDDAMDMAREAPCAETMPLSMTLCALRASPEVTEEQIQEALK